MTSESSAWPEAVFDAPILRALDDAARTMLRGAGRLHALASAGRLFERGDPGDGFFVVVHGVVELRSPDGVTSASVRRVTAGEVFGEEASLGLPRRARAVASTASLVVEIPTALFRRGAGRSGALGLWERELRLLRRAATRELLIDSALAEGLAEHELDRLLDAARHESHERGESVFEVGSPVTHAYLVADGLVALQSPAKPGSEDLVDVHAWLSRGDLFGHDDGHAGSHTLRAVATGNTRLVVLPLGVLDGVMARHPEIAERSRTRATKRHAQQVRVVGQAAMRATRHAFSDLHRMHVARSLLVIDHDSCVRCGHCTWSCAQVHGDARLVRSGEKVVARLKGSRDASARSLLLPSACQHCSDPVCMSDCPTGAIERGAEGEVFSTEARCTGCGNCAKACPWEAIRLAPRRDVSPVAPSIERSADIAVKCDLCREYEAPACVQACPTRSIERIEPTRDLVEVAEVLGAQSEPTETARASRRGVPLVLPLLAATVLGLVVLAWRHHVAGGWAPGHGWPVRAGWTAVAAFVGLLAHTVPKRGVRLWMRRRRVSRSRARARPRSIVAPFVGLHIGLGLVAAGAAVAHAGPRMPSGVAGSLYLTWLLLCALGLWGALAYRWLPTATSRLEREGVLPEDLPRQAEALVDRLHRQLSGRGTLIKTIAERLLLPYARAPWGPVALILSRRSLPAEQTRIRARIDTMLQGRGASDLVGLDALIRTAVELRALPARRMLHLALRGWLIPHVMLTGIVTALALVHVVAMTMR
jgi:Fe-S-cluster-containing dehydrogenase component/CRP-like cAMP-binding protein